MKWIFTPIIILFSLSFCYSQDLTGIWRGYFLQKDFDIYSGKFREDRYKYEVQINNLKNNGVEGVTFSYKTTIFYGKAGMQGVYKKQNKSLVLSENKMIELKMSSQSQACLMTCYLDYKKSGKTETLTGTYTSFNNTENSDCGSGTVYLEKVTTTDFVKEPFLLKKEAPKTAKTSPNTTSPKVKEPIAKKPLPKTIIKPETKKPEIVRGQTKKPLLKPGAEGFIVSNNEKKNSTQQKQEITIIDTVQKNKPTEKIAEINIEKELPKEIKTVDTPLILKTRINQLAKTLVVDNKDVRIDFYDNGEIDNDTISVYHNNVAVINKGKLSNTPITLEIKLSEQNPLYELITVAENLGVVPPNTALMVITAGKKRYEIVITSDNSQNAKVIIAYTPQEIQVK